MKKIKFNAYAMGAILLVGILFASCKKSTFENNDPQAAGLMVFNLAPDQSDVVVGINGTGIFTNTPLGFTQYTGGYVGIFPGNRSIEAYDNISGDTIANASFDFESNKYYSSFIVGSDDSYQNVIVLDNFDSLSTSEGKAYIRYINAIPGSVNPSVTVTANGTPVTSSNPAFATISDFVAATPGEVSIAVNEGTTVNASRTITVEQNGVYTVLLVPGATTADPAQIKFITNGTLDGETGQRSVSSAQIVNIN